MGGEDPSFNKLGKVWKRKQDLSSHLAHGSYRDSWDCEIIEYQIVEVVRHDIEDWQDQVLERRNERKAKSEQRHRDYAKEQRLETYERLKKEFEG